MEYACGFVFSNTRHRVALVKKNRPTWQAGKINAPGGKVEPGETPLDCMVREFEEETGVRIEAPFWEPVCVLVGGQFKVHFFAAFTDDVFRVRTMEDEQIFIADVNTMLDPFDERLVPGLVGQMALALDTSGIVKPVMISSSLKGG